MRFLKKFGANKSGNVGIILALLAFPLCAFVGAVVDGSSVVGARNKMQKVLDAAAGGVALQMSLGTKEKEIRSITNALLESNLGKVRHANSKYELIITPKKRQIDLSAKSTVRTSFLHMIGFKEFKYSVTTRTFYRLPEDKKSKQEKARSSSSSSKPKVDPRLEDLKKRMLDRYKDLQSGDESAINDIKDMVREFRDITGT